MRLRFKSTQRAIGHLCSALEYLAPLAALLGAITLVAIFENESGVILPDRLNLLSPQTVDLAKIDVGKEMSLRIQWSINSVFLSATVLAALIGSLFVIRENWKKFSPSEFILLRQVGWASAVLFLIVAAAARTGSQYGFFCSELGQSALHYDLMVGPHGSIGTAVDILAALGILATFAIALAFCSTLKISARSSADELRRQLSQVQVLLVLGSFLLVAGTLEVSALYKWAQIFLHDTDSVAENLVESACRLAGFVFSLFLSVLYLTTTFIISLKTRAAYNRLVALSKTTKSESEWKSDNDLSIKISEQMFRLAALLAPFLAGGAVSDDWLKGFFKG